jgi:hypothetical protein
MGSEVGDGDGVTSNRSFDADTRRHCAVRRAGERTPCGAMPLRAGQFQRQPLRELQVRTLTLLSFLCTSASAFALEHAILEVECRYPTSGSGVGYAHLSFNAASKNESLSLTYVQSSVEFERERSRRSAVQYSRVDEDHYVSAGSVYTIRNIEKTPGLVDNACDEGVSLLVSKVQGKPPTNVSGMLSKEVYLLDGVSQKGWRFVHKQVQDKSSENLSHVVEKFYFQKP